MCEVQCENGQYLRFNTGNVQPFQLWGICFGKLQSQLQIPITFQLFQNKLIQFSSDNVVNLKHVVLANLGL